MKQLATSGAFTRSWGLDVVASGPNNAGEAQNLVIAASGGTFALTFQSQTTGAIAYNASAATVDAELEALSSIPAGAVSVTGGPGSETDSTPYQVSFEGALGGTDVSPITVGSSLLTGGRALGWGVTLRDGKVGVNELQRVLIAASGGIFTLTFQSKTTGAIAYSASAATVDAELEALTSIGAGNVSVTGGPGDETGSVPYEVTFEGTLAAINQPSLAVNGSSLTGGPGFGAIATRNPGNTGAEVCEPGFGDTCKVATPEAGGTSSTNGLGGAHVQMSDLAVDLESGDVYVVGGNSRINKFSSSGRFLRAFGYDVVASGPDDSQADIEKSVTVKATGGTYTLTFGAPCCAQATSGPIPYNAPARGPGSLEAILNSLSSIGGVGGKVTVTGGPGDSTGSTPYFIRFQGNLGGDATFSLSSGGTGNLTGVGKSLTINNTVVAGGAPEVCIDPADTCRQGTTVTTGKGTTGISAFEAKLAIQPPGTANAGNLLVAEKGANRVQEFTPAGAFVRTFGFNVDSTNPSTTFEICTAASGNICRSGTSGTGVGQFKELSDISVDSTGAIYTVEQGNFRVQKFTPSGGSLVPSLFGVDEKQSVKVSATGGQFRLSMVQVDGTVGKGTFNVSNTITGVTTEKGAFEVGQPIKGFSISDDTYITAVGPGTLTLSKKANGIATNTTLTSNAVNKTADIAATATAGEVQTALNTLPAINTGGGSVSVTGGPGDESGSTPYLVTFGGGPLARTDPPQLVGAPGTTPLSGGTGGSANEVVVTSPQIGGPNGTNIAQSPLGVEIGPADSVYVARLYPGGTVPCEIPDLSSPPEVRVQALSSDGLTVTETSRPCTTDVTAPLGLEIIYQNQNLFGNPDRIAGFAMNGETGDPYMAMRTFNRARAYVFADPGGSPTIAPNPPTNVSGTGMTISGTINPNGPNGLIYPNPPLTRYRLEYKKVSESIWQLYAPDLSAGHGTSPVPFSIGVSGLTPNTPYEMKVVADKAFGFRTSSIQTTTTSPAPPTIDSFSSKNVTASSADLTALINAQGTETTYHFEYGPTPAYGESTPEASVGDSLEPESVQQHVEGLEPIVYHFRVVATNALGTVTSTDQTFSFYPGLCPNNSVRQQTGSGSLPDCRAYELVSPGEAGAIELTPGGPNSPYASSPGRFAYLGFLGIIPGPWNPPNLLGDQYVATRSSTGWTTSYVGLPATMTINTTGIPGPRPGHGRGFADLRMTRFMAWEGGSSAPYLLDAQGAILDRLPTNVGEVPNGEAPKSEGGFAGDLRPAADFSHLAFSSANVAFGPGGKTTGNGSTYDNDLDAGTVTVISKTPGGADIPQEPGDDTSSSYLPIPAVSTDGSHVLMEATATGLCGKPTCVAPPANECLGQPLGGCPDRQPAHLYLRVNGTVTYDVSQGNIVLFEGMTEDGSTIYFSSTTQITGDDNDTSVDLYEWSETTDDITRISVGPGTAGDTDLCNASWTTGCGIEVVPYIYQSEPVTDNAIAAESGDIYFYSPEQFTGTDGIPGRRNLYVAHQGGLQHVGTLDADQPLTRIQISPDGVDAAFITSGRLTTYDNGDYEMMYAYDRDQDSLTCVSCNPSGAPSTSDVEGSQDGIFMTDDGRVFFSTRDALQTADTDGIMDVYEYVSGRPQLISSGVGASEYVLGGEQVIGLIGVSADGIDVYFSTHDVLVPQDHNGEFLKFYDARTNGGFPVAPERAPCAAADECHGDVSRPLATPRVGSTANLGAGGNAYPSRCQAASRRSRRLSRQASALRRRARDMAQGAQRAETTKRAANLRRKAGVLAGNAERADRKAKRCRRTGK